MARRASKDPAAVALGRLGGLKGGPARMASLTRKERAQLASLGGKASAAGRAARLSPQRRAEIARAAALARWAKPKPAES